MQRGRQVAGRTLTRRRSMISSRMTQHVVITVMLALLTAPLAAQTDSTPRSPWSFYYGCWSTSSAGAIGPMVCVVPTDSAQRVEFLTLDGDSVMARTSVDASGGLYAYRRGNCRGFERGRWSNDSTRVFIKSDYTCANGGSLTSDALIDRTRSDAFTVIEGDVGTSNRQARVTNFIVQLDTTVFPAEVKRRLQGFRPLQHDVTELERSEPVDIASMVEGANALSSVVLDAWLANRGESPVFAIADRKQQRASAREREYVRNVLRDPYLRTVDSNMAQPTAWPTWGVDWGAAVSTVYTLTPLSVGFGVPYLGYQGGFTWGGWR